MKTQQLYRSRSIVESMIPCRCLTILLALLLVGSAHAAPEVVGWGNNGVGQTTVPSGLSNVVAIAAGDYHSLALTAEGRMVGWGRYWYYSKYVPVTLPSLSNVVAIAEGGYHSLALTAQGRVVGWGTYADDDLDSFGPAGVPDGLSNVVAIAAGRSHSLALTAEGRVVAWGSNEDDDDTWRGQAIVPSGMLNVVAIAAGGNHSLALTADSRVVAWGDTGVGQATVPGGLSNVVAIVAGYSHSLALTSEGRVVAWGGNWNGQTTVPSELSNVVAIAAGYSHSLALTAEGQVVAWGSYWNDSTNVSMTVPNGLSNVVAIAAGDQHSLALSGLPPVLAAPSWVGPRFLVATADRHFHHRILVRNGADAYGAAGLPPGLELDSATGLITGLPVQTGTYPVVLSATNSVGSIACTVTLYINQPSAPSISGGLVLAGLGSAFSYAVVAYNTPEWFGAGGLPAGLVIDAQTGVISGVTVEMGDFPVSLVASNRYGLGTGSLTLRVSPVVAWGDNEAGQTTVPSGLSNVVAIVAGYSHSLALTSEGRVVAWWSGNWSGQATVPSGLSNVVAIATGSYDSLALTSEGRVVAWGNNGVGQAKVPGGLSNVMACGI